MSINAIINNSINESSINFKKTKNMNTQNSIPNLTVNSFLAQYKQTENAVLIDARTPAEVSQGKISGAINIDFFSPDIQEKIASLDNNKAYFVYCRSGQRSMNTCMMMQQLGLKSTFNMDGGYLAYKAKREQ
jgi:rhodanese-related sulfurtransferase